MQNMVGRELYEGEVVHHIDGDPTNDDPSNLELFANHADHIRHHIESGDIEAVDWRSRWR